MSDKKLTLSSKKMICGVCAGLGEYFNLDANITRIIYVLLSIITGFIIGIVAYLILYFVMKNA